MTELVANILASAALSLTEEQPTLSNFTSETNEYEPNLSFHYANTLRRFLLWLDCDFDVMKPNLGNKRPDIIFHKRGIHALNFLVVEVKRSERDAEEDIEKIKGFWFKKRLLYRFGASIVLGGNGSFTVRLLERESKKEETRTNNKDFNRLRSPKASESGVALMKLGNRIVAVKQQNAGADVSELKRKMDRLVYALYSRTPEEIQIAERAK
jgi:hypothetical protein